MKLSIGIVGLPNVGKSTLFNLITKQQVLAANYPFATIDPNVGVVSVPDERLDVLTKMSHSEKTVPAIVEFYDIAGLVKGASAGEGLGNQFLTYIREVNAILHVVRCFRNAEIVHVEGMTDPLRDIDIIETELIMKDLETVNKRYSKAEAEARNGAKEAVHTRDTLKRYKEILEGGSLLITHNDLIAEGAYLVREMGLLTAKPQLFLLNGKKEDVTSGLFQKIETEYHSAFIISDLSVSPQLPELIRKAYEVLGLMSFFTTGEDETRAWTIQCGTKAPQAAGVIHTDFEKKFIRAEVVSYERLVEAGGWNQAKQKGWLRVEGKEYEVHEGDVMVIRHS